MNIHSAAADAKVITAAPTREESLAQSDARSGGGEIGARLRDDAALAFSDSKVDGERETEQQLSRLESSGWFSPVLCSATGKVLPAAFNPMRHMRGSVNVRHDNMCLYSYQDRRICNTL